MDRCPWFIPKKLELNTKKPTEVRTRCRVITTLSSPSRRLYLPHGGIGAFFALIPSSVIRYSRPRPAPRASIQAFRSKPPTIAGAGGNSKPFTQPRPRSCCISCRSLWFGMLITSSAKPRPLQASSLMIRKSNRWPAVITLSASRRAFWRLEMLLRPARRAMSASLIWLRISRRSNRVDDGSARILQGRERHVSTLELWSWPFYQKCSRSIRR